jgi:hypothetical protein
MKTTVAIVVFVCSLLTLDAQTVVPRVIKARGYYLYREDNIQLSTCNVSKWTATETLVLERNAFIRSWNCPTNAILQPTYFKITERYYYYDTTAKAFMCYTDKVVEYNCGKLSTNSTPIYPLRVVEPPLVIVGKARSTSQVGAHTLYKTSEGDVVYRYDATKCTTPWFVANNFRTSPVGELQQETYIKYYALVNPGKIMSWAPDFQCTSNVLGEWSWLKPVGYSHTQCPATNGYVCFE